MKTTRALFIAGLIFLAEIFSSPIARAFDLGFAKEDGGQAGSIFDFAASARSVGMGHAHTGVANDASATYWNPAGLSQIDRQDIVADYSSLQQQTGFGFASYAYPTLDYGTFGWGLISLRSQNFQKRDEIGQRLGSFNQSESALLFSHASRVRDNFTWGFTLKGLRQEIDTYSGTGFGADAGMMLFSRHHIQSGLVFRNLIAPSLRLKSERETSAREGRLGLQITPTRHWMMAVDVSKVERRSPKVYVGTEWTIGNVLALRAGINETEVTGGLGIQFKDWGFDYAIGYQDAVSGLTDLGTSHRFGIHVKFGSRAMEERVSLKWQKKGQIVLDLLDQQIAAAGSYALPYDSSKLIDMGQQVINHRGFSSPQDLYTAQGYIYFLRGDDLRSLQSLTEASTLDPNNRTLTGNIEKIRTRITAQHAREVILTEAKQMRNAMAHGDYQAAAKSSKRILALKPSDGEAKQVLETSTKKIRAPFESQMKLAKEKYAQGDYLGAIRYLTAAKELDATSHEVSEYMNMSLAELEKKSASQFAHPKKVVSAPHVYQVQTPQPEKSKQYYTQGLLLYSQGRLQEASAAWKEAVRYDETNTLAKNAYNRSLSELKGAN